MASYRPILLLALVLLRCPASASPLRIVVEDPDVRACVAANMWRAFGSISAQRVDTRAP
jgi:hypothetical protein